MNVCVKSGHLSLLNSRRVGDGLRCHTASNRPDCVIFSHPPLSESEVTPGDVQETANRSLVTSSNPKIASSQSHTWWWIIFFFYLISPPPCMVARLGRGRWWIRTLASDLIAKPVCLMCIVMSVCLSSFGWDCWQLSRCLTREGR